MKELENLSELIRDIRDGIHNPDNSIRKKVTLLGVFALFITFWLIIFPVLFCFWTAHMVMRAWKAWKGRRK